MEENCEHAFFRCLTTSLLHAVCDYYLARDDARKDLVPFHRPGSHGIKVVRDLEHKAITALPECDGIKFSPKTYQHIVDKIVQDSERVVGFMSNPNLKLSNILDVPGIRDEHGQRVDWNGNPLNAEELQREEWLPLAARIAFPVSSVQLQRECDQLGIGADPIKKEEYCKYHKLKYIMDVIGIYNIFHRPPRGNPDLSISVDDDTTWQQKEDKRRKRVKKAESGLANLMKSAHTDDSSDDSEADDIINHQPMAPIDDDSHVAKKVRSGDSTSAIAAIAAETEAVDSDEKDVEQIKFDAIRETEKEIFALMCNEENWLTTKSAVMKQWLGNYGFTSPVILRGMDEKDWEEVLPCFKTGPKKTLQNIKHEIKKPL